VNVVRLRAGLRYAANLTSMVARQRGYLEAAAVGSQFVVGEALKLPRAAGFVLEGRAAPEHPALVSDAITSAIYDLGVEVRPYTIDPAKFEAHLARAAYPRNYAAGGIDAGGTREQKLLEYFVSLELLDVRRGDVVIDVASEWSIFPQVARELTGAIVYAQDLIYPPGVQGDHIGGSAADMPVPDSFADRLVLHNAFEHFEGTADSDFIYEAWRVLRPGGRLCILPLFMSERFAILSDPLVDRRGVTWDPGAEVIELPWWHNRFGRLYDAATLKRRVLDPGAPFRQAIYRVLNPHVAHPRASLHYALVLDKPQA
jgi:SAM-dependent methyltransferase